MATPVVDVAEVQTITMSSATSAASAGTFKLTLGTEDTGDLGFDATAAEVQEELQGLTGLRYAPLTVFRHTLTDTEDLSGVDTTAFGYVYTVVFGKESGDVDELTATGVTAFTPLDITLSVATIRDGAPGASAETVQPANVAPSAPVDTQVTIVSGTELGVMWNGPAQQGGQTVSKYLVEWDVTYDFQGNNFEVVGAANCCDADAPGGCVTSDKCRFSASGALSQYKITGLQAGTPYYV